MNRPRPIFAYSSDPIASQDGNPSRRAIVTIATNCLHPNTGIDEEIRAAGGLPLHQSITDKRNEDLSNGILFYPTGSVVPTAAGNLDEEYVFHAIIEPIMKITRLYLYKSQIKYLLGKTYENLIKTAENFQIQYLVIPVIDPALLSTEDSIHIAVTAILKYSKQIVQVTFVAKDVYSKFVEKYSAKSSILRFSDDVEFAILNKAQLVYFTYGKAYWSFRKVFSSTFQPDEDTNIETRSFSIGVTSKDPELLSADVLCIVVDKKLRVAGPSYSSVARYASQIKPPVNDMKKYNNRYVFVSSTNDMPFTNTMCIVVESIPSISKNKSLSVQSALGNIYLSILREALCNGFKSIVLPVITHHKSDLDASIVIAIYACIRAAERFHHITFYHPDQKIVNRFLYMLAFKRRRAIETPTFQRLFLKSFPTIPCDNKMLIMLPEMIRLLWDTTPGHVKIIESNIFPVMHVGLQNSSASATATKFTILRSDITNVPARNGAVVNAANGVLHFGTGIAKALRKAAGAEAANECDALMQLYRQNGINILPAGSAAITACGQITHCSRMIHGIGPQVNRGTQPSSEDMYRLQVTYEQIYRLAGSAKMEVLVLPLISTGEFAIDMLQGMKIALYATLKSLPNYGIKRVIFAHNKIHVVRQFRALIGDQNELTFETRSDADMHIRTFCSPFIPTYSASLTKKVDTEIERVWKVTERLLLSHPYTYIQTPIPSAVAGSASTKRKLTPQPAASHKRRSLQVASDEEEGSIVSSGDAPGEQGKDVLRRMKAALRQQHRRSKETQEEAAERKKKDAERQRKKRLSQKEGRITVEEDEVERRAEINREREKRFRENQTEVQRAERLSKKKDRAAASIANESEQQRVARLAKQKGRTANSLQEESDQQRVARLAKQKDRTNVARQEESEEQQAIRLRNEKERIAATRQNETRDQRAARREKDREWHVDDRLHETIGRKKRRRRIDALRHQKMRREETKSQKDARKKRDAEWHRYHRHDPTRPLRKPGSSIITEEQKNYPQYLPEYFDLGECPVCKHCDALTYCAKCCFGGQVHVRLLAEPPKLIQELLIGNSADAIDFRNNIMRYNRSLQMASISCEREPSLRSNQFIKINGGLYFQISGYQRPMDARLALFNQVYQFDPQEATAARLQNIPSLKEDTVNKLSRFFHKYNYLVKQFRKTSALEKALVRDGKTVPERILQLRTPTRNELGGNHPGVMSRPMNELRSSLLYRTDEHGSAPAHGVWVCKDGRRMKQLQYFDPLTDPLCYPLIFNYGEGGFKYGEYKLFPKGTNREEAGYVYNEFMPTPPSSQQEQLSVSAYFDEVLNREDDDNDEMMYDEDDQIAYSHNSNPWNLSSDTRRQIDREISFLDKNEPVYHYRPRLDIDMLSSGAVECGYSSDEDGNKSSQDDEEDSLLERIAAISMEEDSEDPGMRTPNLAMRTQRNDNGEESNGDDSEDSTSPDQICEVPDDEAEFEQSEVLDGEEAVKDTRRIMVSRRQYYLYLLRERVLDVDSDRRYFNTCGASTHQLSQFFIIDQYLRMVKQRNDYARRKVCELRGCTAKSFMMAVLEQRAAKQGLNVGYSFSLSRKVPSSVAWYRERYTNSMVMINKVGHPDIFLTFTGNRNWPECVNNFGPNSDWQSNPIIICEVFHKKSQELLNDIVNRELFGRVAGYAYSIEFQKRGMPHLHMLITLQKPDKLDITEKIEKHVWARIPEVDSLPVNPTEEQIARRNNQKRLRKLVKEFMVHSPCKGHRGAYCQTKLPPAHYNRTTWNQCGKKFPKELNEFTTILDDGSVNYYRPALGAMVEVNDSSGSRTYAGNEWVVPYSPYLLSKYESHINVEVVSQTHVAKYMYKYIFKGFDRALVEFRDRVENNPNDDAKSRSIIHNGALMPDTYAKQNDKMDIAVRRMRAQARKLGVENEGETTVNYDEAILTECFRQTTAAEAAWGMLGFPLAGCSHKVGSKRCMFTSLIINQWPMCVEAEQALKEGRYISPFMAYMNLNKECYDGDDADEDYDSNDDESEEDDYGLGPENVEENGDGNAVEDEYGDRRRTVESFFDEVLEDGYDNGEEEQGGEDEREEEEHNEGQGAGEGGEEEEEGDGDEWDPSLESNQPFNSASHRLRRATNFFEDLFRARNRDLLMLNEEEQEDNAR